MGKKHFNDKQSYILTKETLGVTLLLFSGIVTVILLTNKLVFGIIGSGICTFMYGTFGYASFLVVALCAYGGVRLAFDKKIKLKMRVIVYIALCVTCLFLLFHSVSTRDYALDSYGAYLSACYNNASAGFSGYTFGGVISGLIVYPVAKVMTFIAAYVIFSLLTLLSGYIASLSLRNVVLGNIVRSSAKEQPIAEAAPKAEAPAEEQPADNLYSVNENLEIVTNPKSAGYARTAQPQNAAYAAPAQSYTQPASSAPVYGNAGRTSEQRDIDEDKFSREKLGRKILFEPGEFAAESYRRNMIYNESSYFNHPVRNNDDYWRSFSSGNRPAQNNDAASPASAEQGGTYTQSYAAKAESASPAENAPSYIYGDTPVDNLDLPSGDAMYNSYSVGRTEEDNSFISDEPDDLPDAADDGVSVEHDDNIVQSAPAATPDFGSRERSSALFTDRFTSREQINPAIPDDGGIYNIPSQSRDSFTQGREIPSQSRDSFAQSREMPSQPRDSFAQGREIPSQSRDMSSQLPADDSRSQSAEQPSTASRGERNSLFNLFSSSNPRLKNDRIEPDVSALSNRDRSADRSERNIENIYDDSEKSDDLYADDDILGPVDGLVDVPRRETMGDNARTGVAPTADNPARQPVQPVQPVQAVQPDVRNVADSPKPAEEAPKAEEKPRHVWKKYVRPKLDLLDDYPENTNVNTAEIEESKQIICETLENFRIASEVANVVVGPAITRYDVIIKDKTNIKNALKYRESIAMALMKENVNAYLNYSKGAISVEVPNSSRSIVGLKTILSSSQFINSKPNSLCFAFGKDVDGKVVCPDITKMPHLLVAGTTGSGKSICLSALIISLLYKYGPEDLRFILVDPKQVEFISYDKLPHLMINEIIYDVDKAIKALNWAIKEMERRYQLFKEMTEKGVATKNLSEYNAHLTEGEEKLPKIVIILDEFGDLMLQAKKDIEGRIIRLVQKARACGIHLILATQRPSVDCITGLIKSNLPTRIGFKVNSFDDSRCIFDIGGAEKLLGKGDCYFRSAENPELARIQGCFIDTPEVQRVTDFVKQNNECYFDQSVSDFINTVEEPQDTASDEPSGNVETKIDDTFIKALKFCVTNNQASVSMIQRRFPIGYMKACKIIDWMENMNYVTQSEGSKPRKVLLSKEEFVRTYGDIDD